MLKSAQVLDFVAKSFFSVEAIVEERFEQAAHECWTSTPRSFYSQFHFYFPLSTTHGDDATDLQNVFWP